MRDESIAFIRYLLEKGYNGKLKDKAIEALHGIESTLAQRDAELTELREKSEELERRLEAAEQDANRLDYLDSQRDDLINGHLRNPPLYGHVWRIACQCCTVREAIDAALEREKI